MSIKVSRCFERNCVHLLGVRDAPNAPKGEREELGAYDVTFCNAFSEGIPVEIAYGDNLHHTPLENQGNDIVFEKEEI
jgi:hypothetical protein